MRTLSRDRVLHGMSLATAAYARRRWLVRRRSRSARALQRPVVHDVSRRELLPDLPSRRAVSVVVARIAARITCVVALAITGLRPANAEPSLTLTHEPPPRHLTMRPRSAAVVPPGATVAKPSPIPAPPREGADADSIRDIHQAVQVRVNLGYQVDGAALTGDANFANRQVTRQDF